MSEPKFITLDDRVRELEALVATLCGRLTETEEDLADLRSRLTYQEVSSRPSRQSNR